MRDLADPRWIKLKGVLFLVLGLFSASLLIAEHPDAKTILLLSIAVWSFCRLYYFLFYVIEHYVDPQFRFSGLWAFIRYAISHRHPKKTN